jgi:hypothetical protein
MNTERHPVSRYRAYVVQAQGATALNNELAKPIGIVSSFTHSASSRRPRTRTIASECISIMPDGTRKIIVSAREAFTPQRKPKVAKVVEVRETRAQRDKRKWLEGSY